MKSVTIVIELPPRVLARLLVHAERFPSFEKLIETAIQAYLIRMEEKRND